MVYVIILKLTCSILEIKGSVFFKLVVFLKLVPGAVTESVEHWSRVWEIVSSSSGRVKPMTYNIDTCCFLAKCSALLGQGQDWLAQCQDTVTEWGIGSWCWRPGFPVEQHYKVAMSDKSQVRTCPDITLDVARM